MAFYYRLLFPEQAFCKLEDIERLTPFMYLDAKVIVVEPAQEPVQEPMQEPVQEPVQESISTIKNECIDKTHHPHTCIQSEASIIYPKQSDTLFWCIYIAIHGYGAYTKIGHRYSNTEIEEKQRMVEKMRATPSAIRNCSRKITKVQYQEIMSDFMTNKKLTIQMLTMYAIYHNMRILIITPNSWYIDIHSTETAQSREPIMIYKVPGKFAKYGIDLGDDKQPPELFRFDAFDQPLKAISNYKTADLETIADKLGIIMPGKYKKQDVYDAIIHKIHT